MKRKRFHDERFGLDIIFFFFGYVFLVLFGLGGLFLLKSVFLMG